MNINQLARAGVIAALYVSITYALAPVSFGPIQFRLSEALTVLPILFPESILGLFIGTLIANILGGLGPWDIFGGSLVTLLAAWITYRYRRSWIAYASPIVCNALLISISLHLIFEVPYWLAAVGIGVSEAFSVLVIGIPLLKLIERRDSSR